MKIRETDLREVLDLLITKYPDSLPESITTIDEINRKIGQQDVVRFLYAQLEVVRSKANVKK